MNKQFDTYVSRISYLGTLIYSGWFIVLANNAVSYMEKSTRKDDYIYALILALACIPLSCLAHLTALERPKVRGRFYAAIIGIGIAMPIFFSILSGASFVSAMMHVSGPTVR
jgi:hypothetical protein